MKKDDIIRAAAIAAAHFIMMMGCLLYSFGTVMSAFDDAETRVSMVALLGGMASMILMMPGMGLWAAVKGSVPEFFEWIIVVLNSVLWGLVITLLLHLRSRRFSGRKRGADEQIFPTS